MVYNFAMVKSEVIAKLGSVRAVASLLDISVVAVYRWPDTVPRLRQYQLRERRPDLFGRADASPSSAQPHEAQA